MKIFHKTTPRESAIRRRHFWSYLRREPRSVQSFLDKRYLWCCDLHRFCRCHCHCHYIGFFNIQCKSQCHWDSHCPYSTALPLPLSLFLCFTVTSLSLSLRLSLRLLPSLSLFCLYDWHNQCQFGCHFHYLCPNKFYWHYHFLCR